MTHLVLSSTTATAADGDALVIGLHSVDGVATAVDAAHADLAAALGAAGATGNLGETTVIPAPTGYAVASVAGAGLGAPADLTAERVRKAAGSASRYLAGRTHVVSTLGAIDLGAAAEGHLLGAYVFTAYKEPSKAPVEQVTLLVADADDATAASALRHAVVAGEAVALARDLINTAPNDLPPAVFADRASAAAAEAGLAVEVLDEKDLAAGGYGGILGVGGGSSRPPRLVRISYAPAGATKSVALIGKGITFDSGGLSIKPAAGMENMTSDMSGAAAVVATVIAAAALKLDIAVTATVPLAENLVSGTSYRPGDVLRHFGGKTVHVLNTDAEGRLVLADAIVRAAQDDPDYLIETSTLTGAAVVALGNRTMGVMGTESFRDRVAEIARETGDGGWAMPMPEELREGLDSSLADIANVSNDRAGGMLVAAHYLAEFVPEGLPWVHLDVAGPAYNTKKAFGYTGVGGTGVPVRTILATLEELAAQ
ncbi:leucyl aminopeptidase [Nakamurella silvestris]|nr:leucyl aminopeptidase [Nakamurella silvestris]